MAAAFDFPAFKRAFEAQDVEAWLAFFAPDAEWWEYRPDAPPRSPVKMVVLSAWDDPARAPPTSPRRATSGPRCSPPLPTASRSTT